METPESGSLENLADVPSDAVPPIFTELLELHKYEDGYQVGN